MVVVWGISGQYKYITKRDRRGKATAGTQGCGERGCETWEFSLVLAGGVLVAFVSLVVTPVGCLVGIPLMYARRRLDSAPQNERERAPQ
jgi:hypothetical protein